MGLMSRALGTAQPDGGSLLRRAVALRSRVTADLPPAEWKEAEEDAAPDADADAEASVEQTSPLAAAESPGPAAEIGTPEPPRGAPEPDTPTPDALQPAAPEKKKPSTPSLPRRNFVRRRRRVPSFNSSPRCLTV